MTGEETIKRLKKLGVSNQKIESITGWGDKINGQDDGEEPRTYPQNELEENDMDDAILAELL